MSNGEKNKAYAEIVYMVGGVWQTPVTGDIVKPDNKTKWWHALALHLGFQILLNNEFRKPITGVLCHFDYCGVFPALYLGD